MNLHIMKTKSEKKTDELIQKKIHTKKSHQKERKILSKKHAGHSPIYE
jgi:ERCC4-type nuclease